MRTNFAICDLSNWSVTALLQVSGGLSVGYGIKETAIKEAYEEASIPRTLMDNLKAVGSVS